EVSEGCDAVIWFDRDGLRVEKFPSILGTEATAGDPTHLGFMPDGKAMTGDGKGVVHLWDPSTRQEIRRIAVPGEPLRGYAPDGRWGIFGGGSDPVRI